MSIIGSYLLYYFIVISSSIIAWFSRLIKGKSAKWIFFSAIIIPVIISGFRFGIGTDYFNYIKSYERFDYQYYGVVDAIKNSRYEPGWVILNYLVKYIFGDVKYLFIIAALLTWSFSFKAIYDNRKQISIGIAVLILLCTLYNLSFNITRQALAISIIMLSIKPMLDGKKWRFIIMVLFASSFHFVSLIFLFSYWIVNSKTKGRGYLKNIFIVVAFSGLVYFFQPLFNLFSNNVDLFETYRSYTIEFSGFSTTAILLKIPILLVILLNIKKLKHFNNPMHKLAILYFIGVILVLLSSYSPYINRVSFFFDVTQVFIIAAIVKSQTNAHEKFLYTYAIVIYYLARFTYFYLYMGDAGTMPYNFLP